ncbi:hypothetical protein AAFF_G00169170 [Aldrovandia affinis]|uniref:Uncharacterized protein n=1 Tax=Aldrovandia affinis TaxID=143900 RepID=A0AAD7VX40_9TELE|nr:hypothetical protein AAFF_G00169170 [Aldrovandia affinis]
MLDLLKWLGERINDSLGKLKEIDGSEIVKVGCQWGVNAALCLQQCRQQTGCLTPHASVSALSGPTPEPSPDEPCHCPNPGPSSDLPVHYTHSRASFSSPSIPMLTI